MNTNNRNTSKNEQKKKKNDIDILDSAVKKYAKIDMTKAGEMKKSQKENGEAKKKTKSKK